MSSTSRFEEEEGVFLPTTFDFDFQTSSKVDVTKLLLASFSFRFVVQTLIASGGSSTIGDVKFVFHGKQIIVSLITVFDYLIVQYPAGGITNQLTN